MEFYGEGFPNFWERREKEKERLREAELRVRLGSKPPAEIERDILAGYVPAKALGLAFEYLPFTGTGGN